MELNTLEDIDKYFPTEEDARKYLSGIRWRGLFATCPYCGNNRCYILRGGKKYKCANKECYRIFTVTTNTLLHASNLKMSDILKAFFMYVKKRGRLMSTEFENGFKWHSRTSFILKEKMDFAWKEIGDTYGLSTLDIIEKQLKLMFNMYEHYENFKSIKYNTNWHIKDIDNISDNSQYNKLIYYTNNRIRFCEWIFIPDFVSAQDVLSETFIRMNKENIKEYDADLIIKLINRTISFLWVRFMKEHPKFNEWFRQKQIEYRRSGRRELKKWYLAELIKNEKEYIHKSRSEIIQDKEKMKSKKLEISLKRDKNNKGGHNFISHFA